MKTCLSIFMPLVLLVLAAEAGIDTSLRAGDTLFSCDSNQQSTGNEATCYPMDGKTSIQLKGTTSSKDAYVDVSTYVFQRSETAPRNTEIGVASVVINAGQPNTTQEYYEERLSSATQYIDKAARSLKGLDVVLLPEEFAGTKPQDEQGELFSSLSSVAQKYSIYVIYGYKEQDGSKQYNTVNIIDRKGEFVGKYRKNFPCCPKIGDPSAGEAVTPSHDGVPVFDLDFGRAAILTCFDANFQEIWMQAAAANADIIFWPSAYRGGHALRAYAALNQYSIVANGNGDMIDLVGNDIEVEWDESHTISMARIDLDKTIIHIDYNDDKISQIQKDFPGDVTFDSSGMLALSNWYEVRLTEQGRGKGLSARAILKKYGVETLREYQHRSREVTNRARQNGGVILVASRTGQ